MIVCGLWGCFWVFWEVFGDLFGLFEFVVGLWIEFGKGWRLGGLYFGVVDEDWRFVVDWVVDVFDVVVGGGVCLYEC